MDATEEERQRPLVSEELSDIELWHHTDKLEVHRFPRGTSPPVPPGPASPALTLTLLLR